MICFIWVKRILRFIHLNYYFIMFIIITCSYLCLCCYAKLTSLHSLSLDSQRYYLWWMTTGASMIVVWAVTVGIRKSPMVRIRRCTNIVQDLHDDISSDHRVVTCVWGGGGLGFAQVSRCALACWLAKIGLPVVTWGSGGYGSGTYRRGLILT